MTDEQKLNSFGVPKHFHEAALNYIEACMPSDESLDEASATLVSRGLFILSKLDRNGLQVEYRTGVERRSVFKKITRGQYNAIKLDGMQDELEEAIYLDVFIDMQNMIDDAVRDGKTKLLVELPIQSIQTISEPKFSPSMCVSYKMGVE